MISNAKRLNAKKIDFIKEDIFELGDGEFDLITSRGILVSDIPKVQVLDFFEKVNSLLKEGGIFIFDFLQKTDNENEALNKAEHVKTVFNLEQMTSIFEEVGLEILDFNIRDGMSRVGIIAVTKI
jgi:cyclopropane fatty-acyl-phospholipid synthase-like methyltransferase